MRAYSIGKCAGSLMMVASFLLSTSAYGQTARSAGKDCPEMAAAPSPDCALSSRAAHASLSAGKNDDPAPQAGPLPSEHQVIALDEGVKSQAPSHSLKDPSLSSNDPSPCTTATRVACPPPPSVSVNKLDSDLPSPNPVGAHRDITARPSTANNSYKSDQTKDERGRTVMGH